MLHTFLHLKMGKTLSYSKLISNCSRIKKYICPSYDYATNFIQCSYWIQCWLFSVKFLISCYSTSNRHHTEMSLIQFQIKPFQNKLFQKCRFCFRSRKKYAYFFKAWRLILNEIKAHNTQLLAVYWQNKLGLS